MKIDGKVVKLGDIVINPYVTPTFEGKPNPNYKSLVLGVSVSHIEVLRFDGTKTKFYVSITDRDEWHIDGHIDIKGLILAEYESEGQNND